MTERLTDTWSTRDLPVLIAAARHLQDRVGLADKDNDLLDPTGLDPDDLGRALAALNGSYLETNIQRSFGGPNSYVITGITERGRRAVGLWPDGQQVDALISGLNEAAEETNDPEEKTRLRRAAEAVGNASRDVMTDVMGAVIAKTITG
jgi:hypothetical protein